MPFGLLTPWEDALAHYSLFQRGILLVAGGWSDQPDDYRHDMNAIDAWLAEELAALSEDG